MKNDNVVPEDVPLLEDGEWIITKYITRNGRRIYPKNGTCFKFYVPRDKVRLK